MSTIDDVLKVAKPLERTVHICVAGHIAAQYQDKVYELSAAKDANEYTGRLSGGTKVDLSELEAEVEVLTEEMAKHTFSFKLQGLSSHKWSNLLAEHPDPDGKLIFNQTTFPKAAIAATVVEPEGMDDPEKVDALMDVLNPAQSDELFEAAWELHQTAPKGLTF